MLVGYGEKIGQPPKRGTQLSGDYKIFFISAGLDGANGCFAEQL